jgi:hypothetical protein
MCGIAVNSTSLAHSAWPLHSPLSKNMQADDSLVHIATVETIIQWSIVMTSSILVKNLIISFMNVFGTEVMSRNARSWTCLALKELRIIIRDCYSSYKEQQGYWLSLFWVSQNAMNYVSLQSNQGIKRVNNWKRYGNIKPKPTVSQLNTKPSSCFN